MIYAVRRPDPRPAVFGYHEIFHLLVIVAAATHYAAIAAYALPAQLMEVFRTPDERFADLPGYDFEPHYSELDGLRLHHLDEGAGDPVVCFHGEPTWAYLYRKMLPPLVAAGHRVICPDYAGFGRSDKPTERGWYTYDRHVELVSRVLDGLDVRDATVVVQDWGGPIGLRWAVENPERVARIVILNTGLFTGRVSKGFMAWRDFAERNPDLPVGHGHLGRDRHGAAARRGRGLRGAVPHAGVEGRRGAVPADRAHLGRPGGRQRACAPWWTSSRAGTSRRWWRSPTRTRCFPSRARARPSRP